MPERPLYREADIAELPNDGNTGLWYDKFCNQWTICPEDQDRAPRLDKERWIDTVTKQSRGNPEQLQQFVKRQLNLVKALNGKWLLMQTTGPFVTGLGRNHPVENGFLWHHTLGVPYLPGSSVKGMVGAWIEHWQKKGDVRQHLLGSQEAAGKVIFFDALPLNPIGLQADIITPHYIEYYQEGKAPGDWMSPVPIPFLVVRDGATFCFAVVPRRPFAESTTHCETVCSWLREALHWLGAGSKTAVGYGRLCFDLEATRFVEKQLFEAERTQREEKERRKLSKTPEGRWELEMRGKSEAEILDLARIHLEKEPLRDPLERWAFAQAVEATGYRASWLKGKPNNPNTRVGKKKLKTRARLVKEALDEKITEPHSESPTGDRIKDDR